MDEEEERASGSVRLCEICRFGGVESGGGSTRWVKWWGRTRLRMQTGETLVHLRRGRSPGRSVLPARVANAARHLAGSVSIRDRSQCLSYGDFVVVSTITRDCGKESRR